MAQTVFAISTTEKRKKRITKVSLGIKCNRSWLIDTLVESGLKTLSIQELKAMAEKDPRSLQRKVCD